VERIFPLHSPRVAKIEVKRTDRSAGRNFITCATAWVKRPGYAKRAARNRRRAAGKRSRAEVPAEYALEQRIGDGVVCQLPSSRGHVGKQVEPVTACKDVSYICATSSLPVCQVPQGKCRS